MKVHEFKHEMRTTSSIFGRSHGIEVVFEGNQAKTDGKTIYLPAIPDDIELTNEQVRMMRGYVDHEAGHLRHSDMPLILDKYDRWNNSGKGVLQSIHNQLEDIWMEERVIDEYAGAEKNIREVTEHNFGPIVEQYNTDPEFKEGVDATLSSMNERSICAAIDAVGRKEYGSPAHQEFNQDILPDNMREKAEVWCEHLKNCKNSSDVIGLAKSIYQTMLDDPEGEGKPEDFDPEAGEGVEDGEPSEGKGEPSEGQGQGEGEGEGEPLESQDMGEVLKEYIEDGVPGGIGTNSGDYKGAYRIQTTKYDKVWSKSNPDRCVFKGDGIPQYEKSKQNVGPSVSVMRSKLRRALLAKERRDWDPGREVGRLDSKRLVAGSLRNPAVFKQRKDRKEENTAIYILCDMSGSMHGSKIETARDCAIALSECFEGTKLSYQVSGFTTGKSEYRGGGERYHRYEGNIIYDFKGFDNPLRTSRSAIGRMDEPALRNNCDRDAIVHAHNVLKNRPEARKILFVLSDGHPAQSSDANTDELIRHCKIAIKDASRDGIECIGVGIKDKSVNRIYDDAVVIQKVSDLSGTAFAKFTQLLLKGT